MMAGSYRHITNPDGTFRGTELLDNLGDAHEALEECYEMIQYLTKGNRRHVFEAWLHGYAIRHCPPENRPMFTFSRFWNEAAEGEGK